MYLFRPKQVLVDKILWNIFLIIYFQVTLEAPVYANLGTKLLPTNNKKNLKINLQFYWSAYFLKNFSKPVHFRRAVASFDYIEHANRSILNYGWIAFPLAYTQVT